MNAIALAVVLGAATSCLQAYGVRTDMFSLNRAPGGTLGNRNFVAHLSAFGAPVVLFATLTATRTIGYLLGMAGTTIITVALVLTRSRAGWPMGPCTLVDLVGIDVHVHASEALYEKLREPRMAPPPRIVAMRKAGLLGRKSGRGFYTYDDGQ